MSAHPWHDIPFSLEFGGLYQQQQESFRNLTFVLAMAVLLVFLVLLLEFRSFIAPLAIVWGSLLSLIGVALALWLTDTSLNIISFLGAIIGLGIVAKNGILMLDRVEHLRTVGMSVEEALIQSGRRRLRPVLMTSLAAPLGMLPLAYGIGSGADMLKPLAIAVMGALASHFGLALPRRNPGSILRAHAALRQSRPGPHIPRRIHGSADRRWPA
jgi:multidrug efflux pump subunit AcrB